MERESQQARLDKDRRRHDLGASETSLHGVQVRCHTKACLLSARLMSVQSRYTGRREKEDFMLPHFFQKAQHVENRRLSPQLLSILAAVSFVATVDSASLAEATECPVTEDDGTIPRMATGKGTPSSILPLPIITERDIFGGVLPSPVREVASYMKSSRLVLNNTADQGIATSGACLSQDILTSALFKQAMFKSIGKSQPNARIQSMKISALPYNGKRQVHMIRTTPSEIGVSARSKTATIIGPVQEIQKPILSDARSVSQVVAGLPSTVESSSQFGGQPLAELNPLRSALQRPDNESLRMNQTTTQALHGGNCGSGCP